MSLIQTIKTAQVAARKARDPSASLLTTLIGEAEMVGKNAGRDVTDQEVVATIKKFIKNIDETLKVLVAGSDAYAYSSTEKAVLEQFLPQQLTEEQIRFIIATLLHAGDKPASVGEIMKHMKTNHEGLYDGALVSKIAKELAQ